VFAAWCILSENVRGCYLGREPYIPEEPKPVIPDEFSRTTRRLMAYASTDTEMSQSALPEIIPEPVEPKIWKPPTEDVNPELIAKVWAIPAQKHRVTLTSPPKPKPLVVPPRVKAVKQQWPPVNPDAEKAFQVTRKKSSYEAVSKNWALVVEAQEEDDAEEFNEEEDSYIHVKN